MYDKKLAWQQFRYGGLSPKGVAFLCTAVSGPRALRLWDTVAEFARRHLRRKQRAPVKQHGFQAYLNSVYKKSG